ncbi:Uncharacterised protein [Streptococcus pneumoniae]|nr:Uncharacterised protein [Streptococcus pneumoniae]
MVFRFGVNNWGSFLVATSWMLLSSLANSSLAFCVPVSPKALAKDSILALVEVQ